MCSAGAARAHSRVRLHSFVSEILEGIGTLLLFVLHALPHQPHALNPHRCDALVLLLLKGLMGTQWKRAQSTEHSEHIEQRAQWWEGRCT